MRVRPPSCCRGVQKKALRPRSSQYRPAWYRAECRSLNRVSQNQGYLSGGPHNKDYRILGSVVGSPI